MFLIGFGESNLFYKMSKLLEPNLRKTKMSVQVEVTILDKTEPCRLLIAILDHLYKIKVLEEVRAHKYVVSYDLPTLTFPAALAVVNADTGTLLGYRVTDGRQFPPMTLANCSTGTTPALVASYIVMLINGRK